MGIAIQELLSQEYFKDFYVLAGAKGLHREIQGITVMEAPDAFHWTKGKELVLSSGYVIAKEPDCIEKAFREGSVQKSAGMMIKRERYLENDTWRRYQRRYWSFLNSMRCPLSPCHFQHHGWK